MSHSFLVLSPSFVSPLYTPIDFHCDGFSCTSYPIITGSHPLFRSTRLYQWPCQEPIHWRFLPFIRPIFQAYGSGGIPWYPHNIWPEIWSIAANPYFSDPEDLRLLSPVVGCCWTATRTVSYCWAMPRRGQAGKFRSFLRRSGGVPRCKLCVPSGTQMGQLEIHSFHGGFNRKITELNSVLSIAMFDYCRDIWLYMDYVPIVIGWWH